MSLSRDLTKQVSTLRFENAKLIAENERLKQKLRAIRALCPEPLGDGYLADTPTLILNDIRGLADEALGEKE